MFPRGDNAFREGIYPHLGSELSALRGLLSRVELDDYRVRVTQTVATTPAGKQGSVRYWGMRTEDKTKALLWLFDDDVKKEPVSEWGKSARDYVKDGAYSKWNHTVRVKGMLPNSDFTVVWFNTWDGGELDKAQKASDGNGEFEVWVRGLSTTLRQPEEAWDGADVLLIVEWKPPF